MIFAAGEVKGRTASGPLIVLPRTITTEGSFTNFDPTPLGDGLSSTSVKPLLEGGCGFGCSLSDEGGMLVM